MEISQSTAKIDVAIKMDFKESIHIEASRKYSKKNVEDLVNELNSSLNPFNTSLKFGFDNNSNDFYISVIETKTNEVLRRFPVEEAECILPKMKEIIGLIFDQKA